MVQISISLSEDWSILTCVWIKIWMKGKNLYCMFHTQVVQHGLITT